MDVHFGKKLRLIAGIEKRARRRAVPSKNQERFWTEQKRIEIVLESDLNRWSLLLAAQLRFPCCRVACQPTLRQSLPAGSHGIGVDQ